jgi:hypothetical protein
MGELERVFVSRKTFGKYTSTLEWYVKDNIWIGNCFKSTITDKAGNIIEIVDKIRHIPEKIKPDYIVPPPIEGEPPIENTGKLWYFDSNHLSEKYIFKPPLTKSVVAWVIKIDGDIFIFDSKTGKQIGRDVQDLSSCTFIYNGFQESTKAPAKVAFSQLGFSNIDKTLYSLPACREAILNILSNNDVKYLYLRAHGGPNGSAGVHFCDIARAMENRSPIWFAIISSCNIMEYTGYGSVSYALRKGSMKGTVTIGLRVASTINLDWQKKLYAHAVAGNTWWDSFNYANAALPQYAEMAFCGDKSMKIEGSTEIKRPTGIDKFLFGEVVGNHLPEYAEGYVCGAVCGYGVATDISYYLPPAGYSVTDCKDVGFSSGHGCIPDVEVARVRCDKTGYVPPPPPPPTKSYMSAASSPSSASIWLKKH